jgi:ribosomal protein S12 methylthiotransferase
VDAFIGPGKSGSIAEIINKTVHGGKVIDTSDSGAWWKTKRNRILSTDKWTAYLRIADGCDNRCSYCAIPDIRGGFASRSEIDILDEAKSLADAGVKELNVIAQDVTRYGFDIDGQFHIAELVDKISLVDGIRWIRLLYCYPTRITDSLIDVISGNPKVCKYIDVPLQHSSERVLKMMQRPGSGSEYIKLFNRIRVKCPDVSLRTSFIVGFPGETESDFNELLEFIREVRFDRAGVFKYSREDGTPASLMNDRVSRRITDMRYDKLMSIQQTISLENNTQFVGKRLETIIESTTEHMAVGRSYRDAPEIDGLVYIENPGDVLPGSFVNVCIENVRHYDVIGKII